MRGQMIIFNESMIINERGCDYDSSTHKTDKYLFSNNNSKQI